MLDDAFLDKGVAASASVEHLRKRLKKISDCPGSGGEKRETTSPTGASCTSNVDVWSNYVFEGKTQLLPDKYAQGLGAPGSARGESAQVLSLIHI